MEKKEVDSNKERKDKKVFEKGFSFAKIFAFFLIGCLFGTYYEEILWFIGNGEWVNRQGLIYGPFSPIYGLPVALYVAFFGKNNDTRSVLRTFIYSALLGGFFEFTISFIAEICFGVKFWDYTGYFLNIGGRTTIPFMMAWGILGTFLLKILYPFVSKWLDKIPYKIAKPLYIITLIIITIDIVLTYGAFIRMIFRNQGKEPATVIGQFFDNVYTNEFLDEKFPAMKIESANDLK